MVKDTQLRMASATDLAELRSWFSALSDLRSWGGPEMGWARDEIDWLHKLQWPDAQSFAMLNSQRLLGFGQLRFSLGEKGGGYCHLARLVVHPEARGRGFGMRLVTGLMALGEALWQPDYYSLFVFENNQTALSLYSKLGFQQVGHYVDRRSVLRLEKRVGTAIQRIGS
ncbi:N-acetyltransferase [Corallincola holothuriorum]|uniref:N-acetyltransferase n=1 Tax=Corallincola holothuriorum TaxID=2282215 RepID=A0A368NL13_9GAMM|nr:N-acetyltransferase [Corallincola holothuriorum]RCU50324.1 N-acetyltransferase [Corallincola holothuriorum]